MKLKFYLMVALLIKVGLVPVFSQVTFDTKSSPVFEGYRLQLAGESDGKYYAVYNDKMMQYKEGVVLRLSSSLNIEKKGSYEAPKGKYTGLGYACIKEKSFRLYFADINIGGGLAVAGANVAPSVARYQKQNYDPNTLQPVGELTEFFSEDKDGFVAKSVYQSKSINGKFEAMILLPYNKYRTCKINLTENNADVYGKKFDLSINTPEASISEKSIAISNAGDIAFVIYDKSVKGDKAFLGLIPASTKELKIIPLKGKPTIFMPSLTFTDKNELVVAYGYSNERDSRLVHGFMLTKYSAGLEELSKNEFSIPTTLLEECKDIKQTVKNGGIYDLATVQLHQLANGNYSLVCEQNFYFYNGKYDIRHSDFMVAMGFDAALKPTYQYYIPKFQSRYMASHYFSNSSVAIGNRVFIFHNAANAKNAANENSEITFGCTWLEDGKGKPQTVALALPVKGVYPTVDDIHVSTEGKVYFPMKTLDEKKAGIVEVKINGK